MNKMINAILIDDERDALEVLEWLLTTYCREVKIIALCTSAEEGLVAIRNNSPDIVFLDIEMPRMNGFDLLEKLGKVSFDIVFCTAYDQFAVKAFKYSALHYLLKPIDPDDLISAVNRVKSGKQTSTKEQIELLLQEIRQPNKITPARIALTTSDGMIFVHTSDIIYCEAESNYTKVVLVDNRKVVVSKVLKELDEALCGPDFCRVHSSFLINVNRIKKYMRGDGGYLIMEDDATISISRNRKQDFMDLFSRF